LLKKYSGLISNLLDHVDAQNGNIIGTSKEGISIISEKLHIHNFNSKNILLSNDVKNIVLVKDTVWVATDLGISKLPLDKTENPVTPINLVNVKVDDSETSLSPNYDLAYDVQSMEISFEALSYAQEGDLTYKYQLKGVDKSWITTKNRSVRYTNLPAGQFDFYLSAQHGDKSWTASTHLLSINKAQPFWQNSIFIIGCITIGVLL